MGCYCNNLFFIVALICFLHFASLFLNNCMYYKTTAADCSPALQDSNCIGCGFNSSGFPICTLCKGGYKRDQDGTECEKEDGMQSEFSSICCFSLPPSLSLSLSLFLSLSLTHWHWTLKYNVYFYANKMQAILELWDFLSNVAIVPRVTTFTLRKAQESQALY